MLKSPKIIDVTFCYWISWFMIFWFALNYFYLIHLWNFFLFFIFEVCVYIAIEVDYIFVLIFFVQCSISLTMKIAFNSRIRIQQVHTISVTPVTDQATRASLFSKEEFEITINSEKDEKDCTIISVFVLIISRIAWFYYAHDMWHVCV